MRRIVSVFICCLILLCTSSVYAADIYMDENTAIATVRDAMIARKSEVYIPYDCDDIYKGAIDIYDKAVSEEYAVGSSTGTYLRYHCPSHSFSRKTRDGIQYIYYTFEYLTDKNEEDALNSSISQILKNIGAKSGSDYSRVQKIYKWITANVKYNNNGTTLMHSAYAASKGSAVCSGFATLFYKMCKESGVGVYIVGNSDHIWNIVCVDGKWYNVDATWDAQKSEEQWQYFLKCSSHFSRHPLNERSKTVENSLSMSPKCWSEGKIDVSSAKKAETTTVKDKKVNQAAKTTVRNTETTQPPKTTETVSAVVVEKNRSVTEISTKTKEESLDVTLKQKEPVSVRVDISADAELLLDPRTMNYKSAVILLLVIILMSLVISKILLKKSKKRMKLNRSK